jgi:hypothetical protein
MKVLKTEEHPAGFEIRTILYEVPDDLPEGNDPMEMVGAFTKDGDYIGNLKDAEVLVVKRGLLPEKAKASHCVCSIGFCPEEDKWYGWSHRAILGFGVGDMIYDGAFQNEENKGVHPCDDTTPYLQHGTVPIMNMDDAKKSAIAFADSVS